MVLFLCCKKIMITFFWWTCHIISNSFHSFNSQLFAIYITYWRASRYKIRFTYIMIFPKYKTISINGETTYRKINSNSQRRLMKIMSDTWYVTFILHHLIGIDFIFYIFCLLWQILWTFCVLLMISKCNRNCANYTWCHLDLRLQNLFKVISD